MSPPLPVISGSEAIKAFGKIGYRPARQKGSHVRLIHPDMALHSPLTIPMHKELDAGLLRSLIRVSGLSVDEFLSLL